MWPILAIKNPARAKMALKLAYKILTDKTTEKRYMFTFLRNSDGAQVQLCDAQEIVKKVFDAIVEQEGNDNG